MSGTRREPEDVLLRAAQDAMRDAGLALRQRGFGNSPLTTRRWPRLHWYKRHGIRFPFVYRSGEGGLWIGRLYVYWPAVIPRRHFDGERWT